VLILCFGVMTLTYWIKAYQFESFYYAHLLSLAVIIPFGAIHGAPVLSVLTVVWLIEVGTDLSSFLLYMISPPHIHLL
jgi:hypothetical protein